MRYLALLLLFVSLPAQAVVILRALEQPSLPEYVGQGTWQPTLDLARVAIYIKYPTVYPIVCGIVTDADACATYPDEKPGRTISARGCQIGMPAIDKPPTDAQLITIGRSFYPCVKTQGRQWNIVERVPTYGNVSWTIVSNERQTLTGWNQCTIEIPKIIEPLTHMTARTLGHEVLHCFNGRWHISNPPEALPPPKDFHP